MEREDPRHEEGHSVRARQLGEEGEAASETVDDQRRGKVEQEVRDVEGAGREPSDRVVDGEGEGRERPCRRWRSRIDDGVKGGPQVPYPRIADDGGGVVVLEGRVEDPR